MPDAIEYCDNCGRMIQPTDLHAGHAISCDATSLCIDCTSALPADTRAKLASQPSPGAGTAPGRKTSSRRKKSARPATAAPKPKASPLVVFLVVALATALTSTAVAILLVGGETDEPQPANTPPPMIATPVPMVPTPAAPPQVDEQKPVAAAAQRLASIESLRTSDLSKYAEMRQMLSTFLESNAGEPEAKNAKALLREIDAAHAKLADDALAGALSAARAKMKDGSLDEAELRVRSIESRFGDGPWFEAKGEDAVTSALAEIAKLRAERQGERAAVLLEKSRSRLAAGDLAKSLEFLDGRARWPADDRAQAERLAAEIEAKVTAAAAAKKRAAELDTVFAEFDRLIELGAYGKARAYAESKAVGDNKEVLDAAARVARAMADAPKARLRGAKTLVGREVAVKLTTGTETVTVKGVGEDGLTAAKAFTINNQTRMKPITLSWDMLHTDQVDEFVRLGGLDVPASDMKVAAAYMALASGDFDEALSALDAAGDTPLTPRLIATARKRKLRRAYETAMESAEEMIEEKKWEEAIAACEKALELQPKDPEATELLAEIYKRSGRPLEMKLDLGPSTSLGTGGGVKMELVYIRPGTFVMGGDEKGERSTHGDQRPKHEVVITKGFYLGTYEVTQAQYEAVMGENPSVFKGATRPAENVLFKEVVEFCKKASEKTGRTVRLPTEAEWEYACRAGTTTKYSFGDDEGALGEYAWYRGNSGKKTHEVGQKKPNAWGLYDMHGNAHEFVADWYSDKYYASSPREDPTGPRKGSRHLLRGGGGESHAGVCLSAFRRTRPEHAKKDTYGFRVAVTAPAQR